MISIYWKSGDWKGYSDILPSWWFETERKVASLEYDVQGPGLARTSAKCSLTVTGAIADLDYGGEHTAFNAPSFHVGVMKLTFENSSRTRLKKVEWRYTEESDFKGVDVEWSGTDIAFKTLETFDPANMEDGRRMIERMVTLRQGQPAFRAALMKAYNRRCAITGCNVEAVLEAAHISPYDGKKTNHVTNGLLLRADIHTLFDRGLIKVYGDYRIEADKSILRALKLTKVKSITAPKSPDHHPNPEALDQKAKGS